MNTPTRKAMLIYQGGIANVFEVSEIDPAYCMHTKRIMQSDFRGCANFCRGLVYAGFEVRTCVYNMAGDISEQLWSWDLDTAPFNDEFTVSGPRMHDDPYYKVGGTD